MHEAECMPKKKRLCLRKEGAQRILCQVTGVMLHFIAVGDVQQLLWQTQIIVTELGLV